MKINYNHLYYFWQVVRLGGITRAGEVLHLTPQTISGQLKQFQAQFGELLLVRSGKKLVLSQLGEQVYEHADAMFSEQETLLGLMDRGVSTRHHRLRIGAADVLPKLTVRGLLEPVLQLSPRPMLSVREVELAELMDDLAHRRLDAIITDRPLASAGHARTDSQLVLSSEMAIYAATSIAGPLHDNFPQSLHGAPVLLPSPVSYARRLIEEWFHQHDLHPEVVAEIEDSALTKSFGQMGHGFFAAPLAQAEQICEQYQVQLLGKCDGIEEQFFVVTLADGPVNPTVKAWLAELVK